MLSPLAQNLNGHAMTCPLVPRPPFVLCVARMDLAVSDLALNRLAAFDGAHAVLAEVASAGRL